MTIETRIELGRRGVTWDYRRAPSDIPLSMISTDSSTKESASRSRNVRFFSSRRARALPSRKYIRIARTARANYGPSPLLLVPTDRSARALTINSKIRERREGVECRGGRRRRRRARGTFVAYRCWRDTQPTYSTYLRPISRRYPERSAPVPPVPSKELVLSRST